VEKEEFESLVSFEVDRLVTIANENGHVAALTVAAEDIVRLRVEVSELRRRVEIRDVFAHVHDRSVPEGRV
jgi:hypothetical protein